MYCSLSNGCDLNGPVWAASLVTAWCCLVSYELGSQWLLDDTLAQFRGSSLRDVLRQAVIEPSPSIPTPQCCGDTQGVPVPSLLCHRQGFGVKFPQSVHQPVAATAASDSLPGKVAGKNSALTTRNLNLDGVLGDPGSTNMPAGAPKTSAELKQPASFSAVVEAPIVTVTVV